MYDRKLFSRIILGDILRLKSLKNLKNVDWKLAKVQCRTVTKVTIKLRKTFSEVDNAKIFESSLAVVWIRERKIEDFLFFFFLFNGSRLLFENFRLRETFKKRKKFSASICLRLNSSSKQSSSNTSGAAAQFLLPSYFPNLSRDSGLGNSMFGIIYKFSANEGVILSRVYLAC